jgi:hypothetical protein
MTKNGRECVGAGARVTGFNDQNALAEFFARCDRDAGEGIEPGWMEHRRQIEHSRCRGLPKV